MDIEPKNDELWGFIARCAYAGLIMYLVLLVLAFIKDLLRKSKWFSRYTATKGSPYSPLGWHRRYLRRYRNTNVFYYVELLRFLLNGTVCVLYIIGTYRRSVPEYITIFYRVAAAFFIADILFILWTEDSAITRTLTVVFILEAFSIPSLIITEGPNAYLNFSFLRSVQTYVAFDRLERRAIVHLFSTRRLIGKLALQCVTLFYTLAAGIQLLEVPGDLLSTEFRAEWDAFGDWNFFNAVYFIIVTLSTVGYGDFSPSTVQGRIYTILIIIIGIVIFTSVIGELVEQSSRGRGSGSFVKNPDVRHVIVTGTPTLSDLTLFVAEFYTDIRDSNADAKIVVLVENPTWTDTEWYQRIARNQFLQTHLQYLIGSPRNPGDLQRARIGMADAVFFLTSPSVGEEPTLQDTSTVMNILAVRNMRTDVPIYAQTLLEKSNLQTDVALRTPTSFVGKETFTRDSKLMRKGSSYLGLFHQVLKNEFEHLPRAHKREGREEFMEVLRHHGDHQQKDERLGSSFIINDLDRSQLVCLQEIHMALMSGNMRVNGLGTLLSNMYLDVPVEKPAPTDPAWISEYHLGATCSLGYAVIPDVLDGVAVRDVSMEMFHLGLVPVALTNPRHIEMTPILATEEVFRGGDIGMFLTYHEQRYIGAALHLVAERFRAGRMRHFLHAHASSDAISGGGLLSDRAGAAKGPFAVSPIAGFSPLSRFSEQFRTRFPSVDIFDDLGKKGENRNSRGAAEYCGVPETITGHVIIAMEADTPSSNLALFLTGLWRQENRRCLRNAKKRKVVVIHPNIKDDMREDFVNFEGRHIFFVEGSPASCRSWARASLKTAKSVATMADYIQPWHISDARSIFTLLTLEVSTTPDHDVYICTELVDEKALEYLREPIHSRRKGAMLGDHVATPVPSAEPSIASPAWSTHAPPEHLDAIEGGSLSLTERHRTAAVHFDDEDISRSMPSGDVGRDKTAVSSQPRAVGSPSSGVAKDPSNPPLTSALKSRRTKVPFMETKDSSASVGSMASDEFKGMTQLMSMRDRAPKEAEGTNPNETAGAARARRGSLFSRSRYASGELLVHSSAITLLAREYTEPGFANFYTNLLGATPEAPGLKIRLLRIPKAIFAEEHGAVLRKKRFFIPYNIVFRSLIRQGVTPLGIYRSGEAPALIPRKSRARRGLAILEQLEPFFDEHDAKKPISVPKVAGAFSSLWSLLKDLMPYRAEEQKGRHEILGGREPGQQIDDSDDSDDDPSDDDSNGQAEVQRGNETEVPPSNAPSIGARDVPRLDLREDSEEGVQDQEQDNGGPSAAASPRRLDYFARFLGNDDSSLEVPGQTKYRERVVSKNLLPYVYTLPDPNTLCAESDAIYVLCDPSAELSSKWTEEVQEADDSED
eukprot:GFKZ01004655.1.p1 GENE.GFKZ01004655.1~~GFKZ01004655.1.p1  ORF type:complete len:1381 (-),score=195.14 GFKZ01004655.1:1963-6105(-)